MDKTRNGINKIVMYICIVITILLIMSAIVFFDKDMSELSFSGGGKAGFFVIALAFLQAVLSPVLGGHALAGAFLTLALISGASSCYYFKKIINTKY